MPKNKLDKSPPSLSIDVADTIHVSENIRLRGNRKGRKKHTSQIDSKDDLHRDSGEWVHIIRVIDWENYHYTETIKTQRGDIIRNCNEPLTKHQGRGSAKKRSKQ